MGLARSHMKTPSVQATSNKSESCAGWLILIPNELFRIDAYIFGLLSQVTRSLLGINVCQ